MLCNRCKCDVKEDRAVMKLRTDRVQHYDYKCDRGHDLQWHPAGSGMTPQGALRSGGVAPCPNDCEYHNEDAGYPIS